MNKKILIPCFAILVALHLIIIFILLTPSGAPKRLSYGIYRWHLGPSLDPRELQILSSKGVRELFIRVAELRSDTGDGRFLRISPDLRKAIKGSGMEVHIVIGFSDSFPRSGMDPEILGDSMVRTISHYRKAFESMNIKVKGVQVDMEGREVDLVDYIEVLDKIRSSVCGCEISITIPYYWMEDPLLKPLVKKVDFLVPMMYDYMVGRTLSEPFMVADPGWIKGFTRRVAKLGKPFYSAISTYSYSSLYDPSGRLSIQWTRISPRDLIRTGAFKEIEGDGRDRRFLATSGVKLKGINISRGSVIRFDMTDGRRLKEYISEAKRAGGKLLRGLVFFRLASKGEELVMDAEEIAEVLEKTTGKEGR